MDKVQEQKLSTMDDKHLPKPNMSVPAMNLDTEKKRPNSTNTSPKSQSNKSSGVRWNCLCSPTTHAGSFRCRLHRGQGMTRGGSVGSNLSELALKSSSISDLV